MRRRNRYVSPQRQARAGANSPLLGAAGSRGCRRSQQILRHCRQFFSSADFSRNVSGAAPSPLMMFPNDFVRLVDDRGPALLLYARQWCHAPEDVVQDAFLKLVALHPPPRDVVAWLYRVVRNAAIDAGKADQRRQRRETATARPARWFVEPTLDG